MADPIPGATLVRLFKGEGLTVKAPHANWMDHQRDEETGKPFGPVNGVMIHHTAALNAYHVVYGGRADLPGPLAHAYIDKAGVIWMASDGRANHAGLGDQDVLNAVRAESYATKPPAPNQNNADGNDHFYGFECENKGNGTDPWPKVQYQAMVKATVAILRHYKWTERSVIGHKEWTAQKPDPRGFEMPDFRRDVKACLALKPGAWPPPPATTPPAKLTVEQRLDRIEKKLGLQ